MSKRNKLKLVLIKWLDHTSMADSVWRSAQDLNEDLRPVIIYSVGWQLKDTDGYIVVAAHGNEFDTGYCGEMCILKSAIVKRWVLEDPTN